MYQIHAYESDGLTQSAQSAAEAASSGGNLQIYAKCKLSSDSEPVWRHALIIDTNLLSALSLHNVGWLAHAMFSITGTYDHFEHAQLATKQTGAKWNRVDNDFKIGKQGAAFRYVAELEGEPRIPQKHH